MNAISNMMDAGESCYCDFLQQCASVEICLIVCGVEHLVCAHKAFSEHVIFEADDGCRTKILEQDWIIPCEYLEGIDLKKCDEICWINKRGAKEYYVIVPQNGLAEIRPFGAHEHCQRISTQRCRVENEK